MPPDGGAERRIVAIVLNWNGGADTLACVASLRGAVGVDLTVVVADNGSTDGSVEAVEASHPDVEVLRFGENLGFAAGNNRALRHAFGTLDAPWACLVNSDVIAAPDALARLLDEAEARGPGVGALGPCLLYKDRPDVIWARGGAIGPTLNATRLLDHGSPHVPARAEPREVDYLPGTFLLMRRQTVEATGLLDEDFFCYLEDADWGVRLAAAGFSAVVVPSARAWHGLSASTGGGYTAGRKYMTAVNSVRFLRKHGTWRGWAALLVLDLALWPVALLRAVLRGQAAGAVAKLEGLLAGLAGARVDAAVAARYARRPS